MAYIVSKTNGQILATIQDGQYDDSTSLKLVGKNFVNYGQLMAENLVKLLENFSNSSPPTQPITGQIWYDSANKKINVWEGTSFSQLLKSTIANTAPSSATTGDSWWNTTSKTLSIKDGNNWVLVGPISTSNFAKLDQGNTFADNVVVLGSLRIGSQQSLKIEVDAAGNSVVSSSRTGSNLTLGVTLSSGSTISSIKINGETGRAEVDNPISVRDVANKGYVDTSLVEMAANIAALGSNTSASVGSLASNFLTLSNGIQDLQQFKANINSPILTGIPQTPTPTVGNSTKQIANAEYVQQLFATRAPTNSPILTGNPQAPTLSPTDSSHAIATTAFVQQIASTRAPISNPILSGTPQAPTQPIATNNNTLATTAFVQSLLPQGVIVMWSGSTIPSGWALCDGSNGTPDLRGRFVVGSGAGYNTGTTGGSATISTRTDFAGEHDHSGSTLGHALTVGELPSHTHNSQYDSRTPDGIDYPGAGSEIGGMGTTYTYPTTAVGSNLPHSHGITASGIHAHQIAASALPPYYALAYIMKVI